MRMVPSHRVRHGQPMHEPRKVAIGLRPEHEMPVVWHQAKCQQPQAGMQAKFAPVPDFPREVDAKDDTARSFYARFGFRSLTDDRLHMFLSMETVRQAIGKGRLPGVS